MPPRCAIVLPVPVPYREPLLRLLAERGRIEPVVIYQSGAQPGWDQRPDWFPATHPYPSEVLRAWQRPRPGRTPVMLPRGLGRALRRLDPACVVSSEFGPATLRALTWSRPRRRPVVVLSELTPWSDAELGSRRLALHRRLAPRMDGFVAVSSGGRRRLEGMGVAPERIAVSIQSADLDAFRDVPRSAGSDGRPLRVLAVGRLVPDKGLDVLIEAFAGLAPGEATLTLCGTGPEEDSLKALSAARGVQVRFTGYAPPSALPGLYAEADVLALVSPYEPFGVTMREGAAAGMALLCSRTAGAAYDVAVDGENALVVEPGSVESVGGALGRLVREPGLRQRLAEGSRAVTARHPLVADAEAFESAVLAAINRGARGGPRS